jgi:hypothetical protein
MRYVFTAALCVTAFAFPAYAQTFTPIYEPEGINMPGTWNNWTAANGDAMGKLRMQRRTIGGGQYVTTVSAGTTGQTVQPGNHSMLFTSGPSTNFFQNKWGGAALAINDTSRLIKGGADNTITVANGHYTFVFDDRGYSLPTRVATMFTSNAPVSILSVNGLPTTGHPAGESVTVTVKVSAIPSAEEIIYVRYSTDGWKTAAAVRSAVSFNAQGEAPFVIPGQPSGTILSFYVLSSTVNETKLAANADRFTIQYLNNNGLNYSIAFGMMPVLVSPGNFSVLDSPRELVWNPQSGAVRNRVQLARRSDAAFTAPILDTLVSISTAQHKLSLRKGLLAPGDTFLYRVRGDSTAASLWSVTHQFRYRPGITFANLETPNSMVRAGDTLTVEGRLYIEGRTPGDGAASGVQVWSGLHTANTDPATWPENAWIPATYSGEGGEFGNDDVYAAKRGYNLAPGTYFLAFRFRLQDDADYFGGHSTQGGGKWDGVKNVSSVLSVTRSAEALFPASNALAVDTLTRFVWRKAPDATAYDMQVALVSDPGFTAPVIDVTATADTTLLLTAQTALKRATWYVWRVRVSGAGNPFTAPYYFKTASRATFYNTQFLQPALVKAGDSTAVYGQIYVPGYTDLPEMAAGVEAWAGFSSSDSDPSTWPENAWRTATINLGSLSANNDEYMAYSPENLASGTYFTAMRFRYRNGTMLYGGWSATGGGAWNGTTNTSMRFSVGKTLEALSPRMNDQAVDTLTRFTWHNIEGAAGYDVQVTLATDTGFESPVLNITAVTDTSIRLTPDLALKAATWYAWRVRVTNGGSAFTATALFKTASYVGFRNLQFVTSTSLKQGDSTAVYAQIYVPGYSNQPEIAHGVEAWIGVSQENSDPAGWSESAWRPAAFNVGSLAANNDEYLAYTPASLTAGTWYVAARFRYRNGPMLYGGYSATGGGTWNGLTNTSVPVTVIPPVSNEETKKHTLALFQNYPNPFNPSTLIQYSLPESQYVRLDVLDVNGRVLGVLVDGVRPAGMSSVRFEIGGLSSGILLYRLQAGGQVFTRKMVLVK